MRYICACAIKRSIGEELSEEPPALPCIASMYLHTVLLLIKATLFNNSDSRRRAWIEVENYFSSQVSLFLPVFSVHIEVKSYFSEAECRFIRVSL